jgi:RNA polymerase sigma factor (sigma-70 family)
MSAHQINICDSFAGTVGDGLLTISYSTIATTENNPKFALKLDALTLMGFEQRLSEPEHLRRITQVAYKQTRNTNVDWQDALQTAQLKLIKSLRAGKFTYGTQTDFDRWAITVAKFAIIDLVRSSKRHNCQSIDRFSVNNLALIDTLTDSGDQLTKIDTEDLVCQMRTAVLKLDQLYPQRNYYDLWLGKVQEKTQEKIAQELGVTQGTISKRWKELVNRLTLELADLLPDDYTIWQANAQMLLQ